jgi:hypothetical protein
MVAILTGVRWNLSVVLICISIMEEKGKKKQTGKKTKQTNKFSKIQTGRDRLLINSKLNRH